MKNRIIEYPRVSIVIPVYNGSNYLRESIDSALNQDYPNIEVIVVNDGSNDGGRTEQIAAAYGNQIRYYYKENGGVASALNYGIDCMSGEYFSWLSHDDVYCPNKISAQIEALRQLEDKTTVISCAYEAIDSAGNILYEINPLQQYGEKKVERPLFAVFMCCINGCALLIHKSHFDRIGRFDESLGTTQDYDLWFRLLRGGKIEYIDNVCMYSRNHSEQGSALFSDIHVAECNQLWLRLFRSLTSEEKKQIGKSEFEFLCMERERFIQAGYQDVVQYLEREILDYLHDNWASMVCEHEKIVNDYISVCNSTCWRITAPLRFLMDRLKNQRRNIINSRK